MSVRYVPEQRSRPSLWEWKRRAAFICVMVVAAVGCILVGYLRANTMERDLEGATSSTAMAIVTKKYFWTSAQDRTMLDVRCWLELKWDNHKAKAEVDEPLYNVIRQGQAVNVRYRIGRSGMVYVDRVEPIYRTGLQQ